MHNIPDPNVVFQNEYDFLHWKVELLYVNSTQEIHIK